MSNKQNKTGPDPKVFSDAKKNAEAYASTINSATAKLQDYYDTLITLQSEASVATAKTRKELQKQIADTNKLIKSEERLVKLNEEMLNISEELTDSYENILDAKLDIDSIDKKIVKLILEIPFIEYFSDNTEWSLKCYLEGYRTASGHC
jgi:chromosome segregation ATPase